MSYARLTEQTPRSSVNPKPGFVAHALYDWYCRGDFPTGVTSVFASVPLPSLEFVLNIYGRSPAFASRPEEAGTAVDPIVVAEITDTYTTSGS